MGAYMPFQHVSYPKNKSLAILSLSSSSSYFFSLFLMQEAVDISHVYAMAVPILPNNRNDLHLFSLVFACRSKLSKALLSFRGTEEHQ